jgi:hypothetical protein
MHRLFAVSLAGVLLTASPVFAADQDGAATVSPAVTAAAVTLAPRLDTAETRAFVNRWNTPKRPAPLLALYGTSALLQGYDAYSTLTVLKGGGVEANPVMQSLTKSPAAFIGLKAGMTVLSIMAAEKMWKNHNRVGAMVTMIVSNGLMAAVAANNAKVLSRVR